MNSLDGDAGSFKSFGFSWVAAFSRLPNADYCRSLTSMAITDFTCFRVVLKRLCVAFLSPIARRYSKSSPATTKAEGKERRNERERENRPHGVQPPASSQCLGPQITSSNLQHCKIPPYPGRSQTISRNLWRPKIPRCPML